MVMPGDNLTITVELINVLRNVRGLLDLKSEKEVELLVQVKLLQLLSKKTVRVIGSLLLLTSFLPLASRCFNW